MIEAIVIQDSISDHGSRLTTMKLKMHRFILAEFNTHRQFSRNASSSRAVPTTKLLAAVRSRELRAAPVSWGLNQKGMQASGELFGDTLDEVQRCWSHAANDAAYHAERMMRLGAHKQICNRLIEPFLFVPVVVSATDYANFFGLRLDAAAQPEMRVLAEAMKRAFDESVPLRLGHGQWHLPFVELAGNGLTVEESIKVSVARCARVSYESFETGRRSTVAEDVALHDRLLVSRHLSPFEHVATPDETCLNPAFGWGYPEEHGNFTGWRQRRKQIEGEREATP